MSSHDTRGRSPNDGRRLQSQSSQRQGYGGRFPSPGSGSGTFRARSSDSVGLGGSAAGSRPISGQRKRPRAMELLVSAQEQLKALSKLTLNPKNGRQPQRRQQIPSRSSSSSSRTPQNILPDKTKFECLQQMSRLLSQSHADSKHVHSPPVVKKDSKPTPNKQSLECKFQETSLNLKDMLRMNEAQIKNYSTLPIRQSRPETRSPTAASKPKELGSPTEASKELGDLQFEYIHNILRKSNALTRNDPLSRTPGGVNSRPQTSDTPKPQSSNKESNCLQDIADILKLNKGQDRSTGKPMAPKIQGKPKSSELRRTATRDVNSKVFQNKVTENLLKSGKAPRVTEPAKDTNNSPKEAVVQTMEQEVKSLQKELELVQAERRGLALQKKLLNCMADVPAGGSSGVPMAANDKPPPTPNPNKPLILLQKSHAPENLSAVELQLNSLREQYRKLQEDYNIKVEEVAMVRVEYEAAKRDALALLEKSREAEARVDDLLERLRIIELEKTKMAGSKDQMMELEQQLTLAKQRYREGQEELEELKTTMQDQMLQLEEYRNKYLSAQQTVEEQRRQIDIMELENNRISEQVNLEIQRVKTQFQEKLQELTPLPDMLKATQLKLQECDQLRQLAERNVEQLLNQSDDLKEQNKKLETELDELKKNSATHNAERSNLASSLTTGEKKIEEIKSENSKLRATVARLEEVALNNDRRLDEKNHEVLQLQSQLETLREESARQVSRTKDRCEAVRRTLQNQISQLECQLAQSRAAARTAQKDRDEIRQRMQAQITSLNDNFEQAQLRIRSLQSHVNYLKSSYTNIFAPDHTIGPKPIDGWSS